MLPKVTIVTPSFNQARFLEDTIGSVLKQRADIHEYFVLDGGSTDGSTDVLARHSDDIDFWISENDEGQADAIRKGFARATGDILAWLNSDDLLLPGAVAAVRELFTERPETQAVTGHFCLIDPDGRPLRWMWVPRIRQQWIRWGVTRICQASTFFRRDFYEEIGGLDTRWTCALDTELWCRMLRRQCNWRVLPRYLAARRYHADTKGNTLIRVYSQERRELARLYPEYRPGRFKQTIGRCAFRCYQGCSPQFWRSAIDTIRHRRKSLSTISAESSTPSR